jgi:hypothetical protein
VLCGSLGCSQSVKPNRDISHKVADIKESPDSVGASKVKSPFQRGVRPALRRQVGRVRLHGFAGPSPGPLVGVQTAPGHRGLSFIRAASSSRTPPSRPRASQHGRASAFGLRGARKASVHIQGIPTGAALALMMRPTTAPTASTSKSSSFHWPDGRLVDARLRISRWPQSVRPIKGGRRETRGTRRTERITQIRRRTRLRRCGSRLVSKADWTALAMFSI